MPTPAKSASSLVPASLLAAASLLGCSGDATSDAGTNGLPTTGASAGGQTAANDGGTSGTTTGGNGGAGGTGDVLSGDGGNTAGGDGGNTAGDDAGLDASSGDADVQPFEGEGTVWEAPAPRATCADSDMPDGELQGLDLDLRCNLRVKGSVETPHFLSVAWYEGCAYVNANAGTNVIDASDSSNPVITTTLTQVGFQSNWETMKASPETGLLVGFESNGAFLTVMDVADDCAQPEFRSSVQLGGPLGSLGHSGNFSPDGTIYYASSMFSGTVFAMDLSDPDDPSEITRDFDRLTHDLSIGADGNRGYFVNGTDVTGGALYIMDTSEIQARAPGAKGTVIGEISWPDGGATQYPIPVTYRGKPYLYVTDELGSGSCGDPENPQWGYARLFDIEDETKPTLVAKVKTEAQDPAHCEAAGQALGTTAGFGVGTHYCNVDRLNDPRLLACGNWVGGLRVYDIRNPWQPREVGYFNVAGESMPGLARIRAEEREIWIAMSNDQLGTGGGHFYVLEIPPGSPIDSILSE